MVVWEMIARWVWPVIWGEMAIVVVLRDGVCWEGEHTVCGQVGESGGGERCREYAAPVIVLEGVHWLVLI